MNIKGLVTRVGSTVVKKVSDSSPTVLVVGGVAVGVVATVLACKETVKAQPVIEKHKKQYKAIAEAHKAGQTGLGESYNRKDYGKDLFIETSHTVVDLAKLYWPSVTFGVASATMILAGHHIISKRYVAAVGAYNALSETFEDYRKRVKDKYGEEAEKDIRYNLKNEVIKEADPENGVTSETKVKQADPNSYVNGTERYFHGDIYDSDGNFLEPGNDGFDSSPNGPKYNYDYLKVKEDYLNQLLAAKGFVTLNRAYEELGYQPTEEGQLLGWKYNKDITRQISLGLDNMLDPSKQQFRLGQNPTILLTFNCYPIVTFRKSHKERANTTITGERIKTKDVFC